jgi:hypothetical protein
MVDVELAASAAFGSDDAQGLTSRFKDLANGRLGHVFFAGETRDRPVLRFVFAFGRLEPLDAADGQNLFPFECHPIASPYIEQRVIRMCWQQVFPVAVFIEPGVQRDEVR